MTETLLQIGYAITAVVIGIPLIIGILMFLFFQAEMRRDKIDVEKRNREQADYQAKYGERDKIAKKRSMKIDRLEELMCEYINDETKVIDILKEIKSQNLSYEEWESVRITHDSYVRSPASKKFILNEMMAVHDTD
jgi:hypothetical protein